MCKEEHHIHTGLQGGWWISGIINISPQAGSQPTDAEIELIDVRCSDFSDTSLGGTRASTTYCINNTSTYGSSWQSNINVKMTGCRGNGINFPYSGNVPKFNLYELNNCYMMNMLNVGQMGLIQHTTFYATSGFSANTLLEIGSCYQPYYSEMIDCTCQTGLTFSTTLSNTLYIDNATWVKSGGTILTSGLLTLNVDYGFPNKSSSDKQLLKYDATNTKWFNANANLSEMADCTITTPTNTQLLQYDGTK